MTAIFKREFKSYFTSPLGYIYLAIFYFFEGMYFSALYGAASPHVEYIFPSFLFVLAVVLVTPVITMRLLSEDRRQKVDQALLTAPVGVGSIVLGKFFSATLKVLPPSKAVTERRMRNVWNQRCYPCKA